MPHVTPIRAYCGLERAIRAATILTGLACLANILGRAL